MPIVAVFYGVEPKDLEDSGQGKAILEDLNIIQLNDLNQKNSNNMNLPYCLLLITCIIFELLQQV